MKMTPRQTALISLVFGFDAFLFDRLHKYIQLNVEGWTGGETVSITDFLNYTLVWNEGISYGFLTGVPQPVIMVMVGAAIAMLVWWWIKEKSFLVRSGLALVLGGAMSNATDRWLYGAVADFFHFHLGHWSFYVFNIADVAITLGAILLILDVLLPKRDRIV